MTWQRQFGTYEEVTLVPSHEVANDYGFVRLPNPAGSVTADAVVLDGSAGTQRFKSVWDERDLIARITKLFLITPVDGFTLDEYGQILWGDRTWALVEPPKITTHRMRHVHHWKVYARWRAVEE